MALIKEELLGVKARFADAPHGDHYDDGDLNYADLIRAILRDYGFRTGYQGVPADTSGPHTGAIGIIGWRRKRRTMCASVQRGQSRHHLLLYGKFHVWLNVYDIPKGRGPQGKAIVNLIKIERGTDRAC